MKCAAFHRRQVNVTITVLWKGRRKKLSAKLTHAIHIWVLFQRRQKHSFGKKLEIDRNIPGVSLGYPRGIFGISQGYIWHIPGGCFHISICPAGWGRSYSLFPVNTVYIYAQKWLKVFILQREMQNNIQCLWLVWDTPLYCQGCVRKITHTQLTNYYWSRHLAVAVCMLQIAFECI